MAAGFADWALAEQLHGATDPTLPGWVLTGPDDTDPWEQLPADGQQVAGLAGAGRAQRAAVL